MVVEIGKQAVSAFPKSVASRAIEMLADRKIRHALRLMAVVPTKVLNENLPKILSLAEQYVLATHCSR
jgi:hypothetical protein